MKEGKPYLGIIGGSGIYDLDNISNAKSCNASPANIAVASPKAL